MAKRSQVGGKPFTHVSQVRKPGTDAWKTVERHTSPEAAIQHASKTAGKLRDAASGKHYEYRSSEIARDASGKFTSK